MSTSEIKETLIKILDNKEARSGMHIDMIADQLVFLSDGESREELKAKANAILLKESKDKKGIFAKVLNDKTRRPKKGVYRYVHRGSRPPMPEPNENTSVNTPEPASNTATSSNNKPSTNFIGRSGEYAVMSELLYNNYNANIMAVDEGIDIVASKNNIFYYIQVKTTVLEQGYVAHVHIPKQQFQSGLLSQVRYFVVVRCGCGEIRYFKFSENDISNFLYYHFLHISNDTIHIKIRFDKENHKPYLYHEDNQTEISHLQNTFIL